MKPKNVIGGDQPDHQHEWECQCARCGSSLDFEQCEHCGGEGVDGHECGEDCCCCLNPEDNIPCDVCGGIGGWWKCLSSRWWCSTNPLPGREKIEPSTPEWFVVEEPREVNQ